MSANLFSYGERAKAETHPNPGKINDMKSSWTDSRKSTWHLQLQNQTTGECNRIGLTKHVNKFLVSQALLNAFRLTFYKPNKRSGFTNWNFDEGIKSEFWAENDP